MLIDSCLLFCDCLFVNVVLKGLISLLTDIIEYLKCRKDSFVAKGQLFVARIKKTSGFSLFGSEDLRSGENEKLFPGGNRNDDQLKVFAPKAGLICSINECSLKRVR